MRSTAVQRSKSSRGTGPRKQDQRLLSHPPQLNGIELRHSTTLRYVTNAAVSALAVTFQNLLDTLLVATTAVAGTNLFQTIKIRRVRIWAVPALGAAASVTLEFGGTTAGVVGDQAIHTDTSMGIQPAHIDARPNAKALASEYQINSNAIAFILTVPSGGVVDIELSYRSQYAISNTAAQNALVGATAGVQYIRGLDGLATATSKFVPEYAVGVI